MVFSCKFRFISKQFPSVTNYLLTYIGNCCGKLEKISNTMYNIKGVEKKKSIEISIFDKNISAPQHLSKSYSIENKPWVIVEKNHLVSESIVKSQKIEC